MSQVVLMTVFINKLSNLPTSIQVNKTRTNAVTEKGLCHNLAAIVECPDVVAIGYSLIRSIFGINPDTRLRINLTEVTTVVVAGVHAVSSGALAINIGILVC